MNEVERLKLRIVALKEGFSSRFAGMVEDYEDKIASLRIQLTEQDTQLNTMREENGNLHGIIADLKREAEERVEEEK